MRKLGALIPPEKPLQTKRFTDSLSQPQPPFPACQSHLCPGTLTLYMSSDYQTSLVPFQMAKVGPPMLVVAMIPVVVSLFDGESIQSWGNHQREDLQNNPTQILKPPSIIWAGAQCTSQDVHLSDILVPQKKTPHALRERRA